MVNKSLARKEPGETFAVWYLIKETYRDWSKDQAATMGAALAYYAIFSLAPLLVIIVAVTGFFLGQETSRRTIMNQLQQSMGPAASSYLEGMLKSAYPQGVAGLAAIIGIILLVAGATSVFVMLKQALRWCPRFTPLTSTSIPTTAGDCWCKSS